MDLPNKLTIKILFVSLVASLGGFLFGYNTSVISGAILFLSKEFSLSPFREGLLVSIILLGALFSARSSGTLADFFGRRRTLVLNGLVYLLGTLMVIYAEGLPLLFAGRFVTGIGVGISSMVVPLYLAETAPARWRGGIVALNQLMITLGILVAYLMNYAFAASGSWRWMFGVALIPTVMQLVGAIFLPEASHLSREERKSGRSLSTIKQALVIGILLSIFQQITGINAVIYYASKIFQMSGYSSATAATFVSIGLGVINVIMTLFSIWLLDHKGRRPLLLIGIGGMVISLGILAAAFATNWQAIDVLAPISLMAYVAFFAIGLGPITFVVISEIYPLQLRGKAMSIATFANWLSNYLVSLTFLNLVSWMGTSGTFALYALLSVLAFFFVRRYIPETKGKTLEEIQKSLYD